MTIEKALETFLNTAYLEGFADGKDSVAILRSEWEPVSTNDFPIKKNGNARTWRCKACKSVFNVGEYSAYPKWYYCPNCGCFMEE